MFRKSSGLLLLFCVLAAECSVNSRYALIESKENNLNIYIETDECEGVMFIVMRDFFVIYESTLGHSAPFTSVIEHGENEVILHNSEEKIVFSVIEDSPENLRFSVSRKNVKADKKIVDCVDLDAGLVHWFGGPQQKEQYWPVEKLNLSEYSYVTKEADNAGIAERYWVNSEGVFIYLSDRVPLFIDQNTMKAGHLCFIAHQAKPYNTRAQTYDFDYVIGVAANAKEAHLQAVNNYLGKPTGVPDERMAARPIWSTWARYKRDIDATTVKKFADEIIANQFTNSQFEIDDDWEICYGALTFRQSKFPAIARTVTELKNMGFRVTLWIHPFINTACSPFYEHALANGYLVLDHSGKPNTQWWNSKSGEAAYIDFTNPDARTWYLGHLADLQAITGIDSFKFDAGESSWQPEDPVLTSSFEQYPSPQQITTDYIEAVASFGPIVEVRSGFKNQMLNIYMRMIDKDSVWTWNNGLPTLITTLLQLNMNGYPFVLPDMIGGNGYEGMPDRELFVRWLQANVFMPSLQFSYVPWDYVDGDGIEVVKLCRHFVKLHEDYTNVIMERFERAVTHGDPVNPPIWWLDPEDQIALSISDEFLLGEEILSAPVIKKGEISRDIYLPRGRWQDGNDGTIHIGPTWLRNYPAPLSVLPYFIRKP